jgi:hypothetical protein
MTHAPQLRSAMRKRSLVRFRRPLEEGDVNGYVFAVGPDYFLIALVSDDIRFNGFQAFRIIDVRELRLHPFAVFVFGQRSSLAPHHRCGSGRRSCRVTFAP